MCDPIPFAQVSACSLSFRAPHAALPVEWRTPYYGETRTTVGFVRC
jgi:hypothetical protein